MVYIVYRITETAFTEFMQPDFSAPVSTGKVKTKTEMHYSRIKATRRHQMFSRMRQTEIKRAQDPEAVQLAPVLRFISFIETSFRD